MDLMAFPHARANQRAALTLLPAGDGAYETTLAVTRPGKWEFRLLVQRGPETFTQTVLRDIGPAGGS
jgi:hypothetical protein